MKKAKTVFINFTIISTIFLTSLSLLGALVIINDDATMLVDDSGLLHYSAITFIMVVIGTFFAWLFFSQLFKLINKADEKLVKKLTGLLFMLFIILSLIIVVSFKAIPMSDSFLVQDQALSIASGNESEIDASDYFGRYKNNNAMILLLMLFFKAMKSLNVTNYTVAAIALNFVMLLVSEVLFYLGVKKLMGCRFALKYLLLSVLHPIIYVTIPWVYTISLCMPFMAAIFYLGVCIYKQNNYKKVAFCSGLFGAFSIIGFYMRPVVLILTIGFVICGFIWLCKDRQKLKKAVVGAICLVIACLVTKFSMDMALNYYYKDESKNYPVTHWVMMGLHGKGTVNNQDQCYTEQFQTKQGKQTAHMVEIKRTLKEYNVEDLLGLFTAKNVLTWSEGTANYNLRLTHNNEYTPLYRYLVAPKNDGFMLYSQVFRTFLFLFSVICLIRMLFSRKKSALFLLVLTALGAMVFYLLWEAKQSYSIPFLFIFIILATQGIEDFNLAFSFKRKISSNFLKSSFSVMAIMLIVITMSIMAVRFNEFTTIKRPLKDISASCDVSANSTFLIDTVRSNKTVTQQFYTEKSFETLQLSCKPLKGNAIYQIDIINGENVSSFNVNKNDIADKKIELDLPKGLKPKGPLYTIKITGQGAEDSIGWNYHYTRSLDIIKGDFKMNKETKSGDLHFIAYSVSYSSYVTVWCYILICFIILTAEVLLSVPLIKDSRQLLTIKAKFKEQTR